MKRVLAAFAAGLALWTPVQLAAAEAPHPGEVDPRIRSIEYDEAQVVTLTG